MNFSPHPPLVAHQVSEKAITFEGIMKFYPCSCTDTDFFFRPCDTHEDVFVAELFSEDVEDCLGKWLIPKAQNTTYEGDPTSLSFPP